MIRRGLILLMVAFVSVVYPQGYIDMLSPVAVRVHDGDTVFIGDMGPGQTVPIVMNPEVKEGGIYGKGGMYDYVEVMSLPEGWKGVNSKLYGTPKQVEVTAAKDAAEGNYTVVLRAIDENNADGLGNVTFSVVVRVRHDIMKIAVTPDSQTVGAYQPAQIKVLIRNTGNAPDTVKISSEGMPDWSFTKEIYVPASSLTTVGYEVVGREDEDYDVNIIVESQSSPLIHYERDVEVHVRSNLLSDYRATAHGTLMYPLIEEPIHALMGIIGGLIG